ncbi:MAG: type IX secretion system protein PorQ [Paludibacter sp.]|nr:type IX secretion system protein PorQ [Paludibacter sp.]
MNRKTTGVLLLLLLFEIVQAGNGVFQFLDLPVSSRMAALGGKHVSMADPDINFALSNPALLNKNTDNVIGLNMANYLADIQFGSAIYGRAYGKNHFAVGVQYVDYGTFKKRNEYNDDEGEFSAKDISLNLIYSRQLYAGLSIGATLKPIYSAYADEYISYGAALDLGVSYQRPEKFFSAGLVFRNIGTQFKGYYSGVDGQHFEPLPFDIQLGASYKLEHAPFRISLTMHNLHKWNLNYIDNENSMMDFERQDYISKISFADMAFRHTIIGVEFVPGKNLYLVGSYNHRRHQELKMSGFKSMAGFSFGGGVRISKFQVGFGVSQFQVGNSAYLFSISTSLNEFKL